MEGEGRGGTLLLCAGLGLLGLSTLWGFTGSKRFWRLVLDVDNGTVGNWGGCREEGMLLREAARSNGRRLVPRGYRKLKSDVL